MKKLGIVLILLAVVVIAAACAPAEPQVIKETVVVEKEVEKVVKETVIVEKEVEVQKEVEVTVVVEATPEPAPEPVTLEFYHWFGADLGETTIKQINGLFHQLYPNVTVEFETADTGTYEQVMSTRLAANDAPDIFGIFPGTKFHPQAKAGYLTDLSAQPWVSNMLPGSAVVATYDGKVMGYPTDSNVIGVIYNKTVFEELGLAAPTNWDDFLAVCDAVKAAGKTPIALGLQSAWVTQLIPYAMAPTAIYRDTPDFDAQVSAGEATLVGSPWQAMMEDYLAMEAAGYFNADPLGVDYGGALDMMASSETIMMVQGNWAVAGLRDKAPDIEWGMFPLPYNKQGGDVWVSAAVGGLLAISANTEHPEEVLNYLQFWASPEIQGIYLTAKKAFPANKGISPVLDPAAAEMIPYMQAGTYPFLDQNWPAGVQPIMLEGIQSVFAGEMSVEEMLQEMDEAWADAISD